VILAKTYLKIRYQEAQLYQKKLGFFSIERDYIVSDLLGDPYPAGR
jgi:hypothetical protein